MTLRHSLFTFTVAEFLAVVLLASAQSAHAANVCNNKVWHVTIRIDGSGKCTQKSSDSTANFIPIDVGNCVIWDALDAQGHPTSFDLQFSTGGFVFSEFNSTDPAVNETSTSGPANGTKGTHYRYTSVVVNDTACNNAQQLGLRMR